MPFSGTVAEVSNREAREHYIRLPATIGRGGKRTLLLTNAYQMGRIEIDCMFVSKFRNTASLRTAACMHMLRVCHFAPRARQKRT